jgi:hypothetical protein
MSMNKRGPGGLDSSKLVLIELAAQGGASVPAMIVAGDGRVLAAWDSLTKSVDMSCLSTREGQDAVLVLKRASSPEALAAYEDARRGKAPARRRRGSLLAMGTVTIPKAQTVPPAPRPVPGPAMRAAGVSFVWRRHVVESFQQAEDGSKSAGALGGGRDCDEAESAWLDSLFPGYRERCW